MSYILHMMGGRDIEVSNEEHEKIQKAVEDKVGAVVRESNGEIITLSTISSSEKLIELPKAELGAVDRFMERRRAAGNHNPQKRKK